MLHIGLLVDLVLLAGIVALENATHRPLNPDTDIDHAQTSPASPLRGPGLSDGFRAKP